MRCFRHPDREAVGLCKSCGKGLCLDCTVDFQRGLACRGSCEADVQALIATVQRNIQLSPTASAMVAAGRRMRLQTGALYVVLGAAFLIWSLRDLPNVGFPGAVGLVFLVFGVISLAQTRRTPAAPPSSR